MYYEIKTERSPNKRRDRHDIVVEILKTAMDGKIKTHIMYKAKLSYDQLNKYLELLSRKGFLENYTIKRRNNDLKMYRTTQKGLQLIKDFETVKSIWK